MVMKPFTSYVEYLDQKGKMQATAITDPEGDTGPEPAKVPPMPVTKGKVWDAGSESPKEPKPYKAPPEDVKLPKFGKGLGDDGDRKLVYQPKLGFQKTVPTWPKTEATLAEITAQLHDLNALEVEYFPGVTARREGKFYPSPAEALRYAAFLVTNHDSCRRQFVLEMKDGLEDLLAELRSVYRETVAPPAADIDMELKKKKKKPGA